MIKSMLIVAILGLCMTSKKALLALIATSATAIAAVAYVSTYRQFEVEQALLHLWAVSTVGGLAYIAGSALFHHAETSRSSNVR